MDGFQSELWPERLKDKYSRLIMLLHMPLTAIIFPCFNEEKRLSTHAMGDFLDQHSCYHFVFVDDGSTDKTGSLVSDLEARNNKQVFILRLQINKGKANAVREGIQFGLQQKKYAFIGYWDADLSTSLNELARMSGIMTDHTLEFVFGSRMKKLNANITRSGFRHFAGRVITTLVDSHFKLGIYDTQCGAKLFSAAVAEIITKEAFVTNWLFDVEIFLRIKSHNIHAAGEEIPLLEWTSHKGSNINILNTPQLLIEFIKLVRAYPNKPKIHG